MAKTQYLTAPLKTDKMPPGVPYIVGNEAAERFSYYGMNSILVIFMVHNMMTSGGAPDHLSQEKAEQWYHAFVSVAYGLCIMGAFLADAVIGKYRTIFYLSIVYCFGHFTLAINDTRYGLLIGLTLIALGAGGIKPCVSANVGDQFGATNQHLIPRAFSWFYFSINFGSAFSTMLIPWMLNHAGPAVAFGTPGVFMVIATIVFWLGRGKFAHIKPAGVKNYAAEFFDHEEVWRLRTVGRPPARPAWSFWLEVAFWVLPVPLLFAWIPFVAVLLVWLPPTWLFIAVALLVPLCLVAILLLPTLLDRPRGASRATQRENIKALANLFCLVPFAAMFWALWQQNFSSWVLQAEHMDRHLFGHEWLAAQIQTVNPAFILIMLPLFSYWIYPAINKVFTLTPLRKFGMGLFTNAAAFAIVAWIQVFIDRGETPHIIWQIVAFVVLTAGEVMVSVTHLEFAYTQAPKKMKSLVMCTYLASVSLGNLFTSAVNAFIQNPDGSVKLQGASYFFFFVKLMLVTSVLFLLVAGFYRGKTYIQDEAQAEPEPSTS